jgi:hypothetical protein
MIRISLVQIQIQKDFKNTLETPKLSPWRRKQAMQWGRIKLTIFGDKYRLRNHIQLYKGQITLLKPTYFY